MRPVLNLGLTAITLSMWLTTQTGRSTLPTGDTYASAAIVLSTGSQPLLDARPTAGSPNHETPEPPLSPAPASTLAPPGGQYD